MNEFPYHTSESAPDKARTILDAAEKLYGMVPNLHRKMAEAPALLEGYWQLSRIFSETSLSPAEQQVVLIAASVTNSCKYCVGAHSVLADMTDVPTGVTDALRNSDVIQDERLEALRKFTQTLVTERGWVNETGVQEFIDAGFTREQVLEVILGVALKTMSNYTNHLAGTELDEPFQARTWEPAV